MTVKTRIILRLSVLTQYQRSYDGQTEVEPATHTYCIALLFRAWKKMSTSSAIPLTQPSQRDRAMLRVTQDHLRSF